MISNPPEEALRLKRMACPRLTTSTSPSMSRKGSPVMEGWLGKRYSKIPRNTGSNRDVYTVLAPNSRPRVTKPKIRRATLMIMVRVETLKGMKLVSTTTSPDTLPTVTWLGTRKK